MSEYTLDEVVAWIRRVDLGLVSVNERQDAFDSALSDALATGNGDLLGASSPDWKYATVNDWVEGWFVRIFARNRITGHHWCPYWWDHGEAQLILGALWRTWELARLEADKGMARWATGIAYPLLRELFDSAGTFGQCTESHHSVPPMLPYVAEGPSSI